MTLESLSILWFVILGFFLAGYAMLDGFDLGVGILHPFIARTDRERRISLNSIGPIWDGNEVWLIVYGGALFAAFPEAYATVFSGFYLAFMLALLGLMMRAVSLEFRGKIHSPGWRAVWDWAFFASSLLTTLIFGVAVGNSMIGVPLDARGLYTGTFLDLLTFYPILVALLTISMFALHGMLYLQLKTPAGPMHTRIENSAWYFWGVFFVLYIATSIVTLDTIPGAVANFQHHPWSGIFVLVAILAIVNIARSIRNKQPGQAFLSSCVTIVSFVALFSLALYPNIITSHPDHANSLTIFNAASSQRTLRIMTIVGVLGTPLVLTYTLVVYWTFRGRVELDDHSY